MHIHVYYINCPVPLPKWFRQGNTCTLSNIMQLAKRLVKDDSSFEIHAQGVYCKLRRTVTNDNHCKRKAEKQLDDKVKTFKNLQRDKLFD